ncbi:MAG: DUF4111 domain-containing protein [Candidatus Eisenbacteria bacterium]|nr:DUF4111 domain-containing protein [Candidatus Eisenbacteria bacterium]
MREQIERIAEAFAEGLRRVVGRKLHGCYIYGAAAFPDDLPTGDFPPPGGELDGYYLLLSDARRRRPPQSQMWNNARDQSWALHCAHIRAGRFIALHGPNPRTIYPHPTRPAIRRALAGELRYVEDHLHHVPHYCILQLCRLVYSQESGDVVVSKARASEWARGEFAEWRWLIELARNAYAGLTSPEDADRMRSEVTAFLQVARVRIDHVRHRPLRPAGEGGRLEQSGS